jgi:hypothetical protein
MRIRFFFENGNGQSTKEGPYIHLNSIGCGVLFFVPTGYGKKGPSVCENPIEYIRSISNYSHIDKTDNFTFSILGTVALLLFVLANEN